MSSNFISVARFTDPALADRAKARLDAVGIRALLVEREASGPNWYLEKEASVVQLVVAPDDEDRAIEILNRPDTDRLYDPSVAAQRLSPAQAEDADDSAPTVDIVSNRDDLVNRAFKAQIVSFIFWPLQLYALYCIIVAAQAPQPLSDPSRRRLTVTVVIHCTWWAIVLPLSGLVALPRF